MGIYYLSKAMDLIARMEPVLANPKSGEGIVKVESAVNTAFKIPAGVEPIAVVNGKRALVYIAEYTADPVEVKLAFDLSAPCRVTVLNGQFSRKRLQNKEKVTCRLTAPDSKGLLLLLETENGSALKVPKIRKVQNSAAKKGIILQDSFDNKTIGSNAVKKHNFSFTPGFKGSALSFRDYESAWRINGPKKLPGKNVELEFYLRLPRPRVPGSGGARQPLILSFNNKRVYRLWILDGSGRLSLVEHQIMKLKKNNRHEEPIRRRNSVSDRLPGSMWMKMQLKISPKEIALYVDGRKEIEMKPGYTVTELDFLQFGNRWQSTGAIDEMVLTSN